MAGTKISDLPSASTLTGAELVPVVQSDVTKKTTVTDILTSAGAGTVTSVNVSGGSTGLTATGGPITTSGTITLGGTLDVDNGGTGATTAANARTNLGAAASGTNADITSMTGVTGGISTPDFIQFDTGGSTTAVAKEYWDDTSGGLSYGMKGGNVTQQIGQQVYQRVYNNTGSTIAKGSVVYATGSSGTRTTIAKALATSDGTSAAVIGITAEAIANNSEGFILTEGELSGVSTSGIGDGEILWLSTTTAGAYTDVKAVAPNHLVLVGYCVKGGSVGGGIIYVKLENGYELGELHDVYVSSPANGQTLIYNATNDRWENHNLTAGSGISITNGAGSITIAASGGGGSVTSVNASGGTTGMSFSGGPITTSGTLTLAGTLDVDNGGTGQTSYTNGQLLIGNSAGGLTKATLTAGSGISITNGNGSITLTAAGSGLGDVTGPTSATDNAITLFNGTTGKIIKQQADITSDTFTSGVGGPWGRLNVGGTTTYGKINIAGTLPTSAIGSISAGVAQVAQLDPPSSLSYTVTDGYGFYNEFNLSTNSQCATYGHFTAKQNIQGVNTGVQTQIGFWAHDSIASGTVGNYGLYSGLSSGANKWNIYAYGTAKNYFAGRVGIGSNNNNPGSELDVKGTIRLSGSTSGYVGLAPAAAAGSTTYTLPSADGTNGQVLKTDGTGTLSWASVSGTGDVVGPASATANAVARFDGATGKLIKNTSDFIIDASNNVGVGGTTSADTKMNFTGTAPASANYSYGIANRMAAPSTASSAAYSFYSEANGSGTVPYFSHFYATPGASVGNITTRYGFNVNDGLLTTGNIYGIQSDIKTAVGYTRFNIYAGGTAPNYFAGNVLCGGSGAGAVANEALEVGNGAKLRISGLTSGYTTFKAPATGNNIDYTLPSADGTNGQVLKTDGSGTLSWTTTGSGTVTSVGQTFTGGLISVSGSPVTSSGTLALSVAGTSGGIPYFSSGTTWASSGALAANALMVGGGAGAAPSTVTTGTGVVTALGVNTGTAGAFVVNGGALGTPSSGTLTNATGLPVSSGISGLGTGVATALAVNTGTAGAFVVNGGALGTPSSGTLTNATGLPISTGVSGLGANVATFLATPSSANLASAVTDETGSGSLVFATSPTLVTPVLGTPTSGNLSNCTADGTNAVGFKNIPQSGSAKTTAYTLVTGDVGKFIQVGTGGSIVIPNSTFAAGDVVSVFNNTSGNVTVTCSTTNCYIAGTDTNKTSVTLATRGVVTILFVTSTLSVLTGNVS